MGVYKNQKIIEDDEELIRQQRKESRIEVYEPVTCSVCQGWGAIDNGQNGMKERCPDCDGEGTIEEPYYKYYV